MSTKFIFKICTYLELKPGYEMMPIFYSPDGKVVPKEEATIKNAEITRIIKENILKGDIEKVIDKLSDVLCYLREYSDCHHNFDEVTSALEEITTNSDLKYKVGIKVLINSVRNEQHLNYWTRMDWAMKILGESGSKQAIEPLIDICNIDNEGVDHYSSMESAAENARDALRKIIEINQELHYNVLVRVLNTRYPSVRIWAAEMLGKLGNKEAIEPLKKILQSNEGYRRDEINEAVRQALKKLENYS